MTTIGITMGCPAGIGPEIILRYFAQGPRPEKGYAVVIGDIGVLQKCNSDLQMNVSCIEWVPGTPVPADCVPVLQVSSLNSDTLHWGRPDLETAKAMASYIETGVRLIQEGTLQGIATCPISKDALQKAGYDFPGHTEMLANLTETKQFAMMMAGNKLKVTLVTIHCPLKDVPSLLDIELIYKLISTTHNSLVSDFGVKNPRIAVAGLNPHGGENQLFGNEEKQYIGPAISRAQKAGMEITGPFPPDTVFFQAANGQYDVVICMYHDQGLIPFKLLHFHDGVNVTLGLPIVRTSVDHGTAYDIAGKGVASHESLAEAVKLATEISINRKRTQSNR